MSHPREAAKFIDDQERTRWLNEVVWSMRHSRDRSTHSIHEWETLRERASQIKEHTLSHLAKYLEQFEEAAVRLGAHVHWARNAEEHNQIVHDICKQHGVRRAVKSKSMLTEECGLNHYLHDQGIEVTDTDLGERIMQLQNAPPSHIIAPAIHMQRYEIAELFHEHLGTERGAEDPKELVQAARSSLRTAFLDADAGITGVNFAVAETGGIVICTNEGNADMGTCLPPLHIACMGIEKLIPRKEHLGVFLRMLARSSTGQPITIYSSHFHGPISNGELHIVLVDNGRTGILGKDTFRRSLQCIRCGACLNTCPVYRRSGGHSYSYTIPGPIGSVLGPSHDIKQHYSLPYASSLCGSCTDVCPVKIDLHHQLLAWRKEIAAARVLPWTKRVAMKIAGHVFRRPRLFRWLGTIIRRMMPLLPRWMLYHGGNAWGKQRELPKWPRESFRDWWERERRGRS